MVFIQDKTFDFVAWNYTRNAIYLACWFWMNRKCEMCVWLQTSSFNGCAERNDGSNNWVFLQWHCELSVRSCVWYCEVTVILWKCEVSVMLYDTVKVWSIGYTVWYCEVSVILFATVKYQLCCLILWSISYAVWYCEVSVMLFDTVKYQLYCLILWSISYTVWYCEVSVILFDTVKYQLYCEVSVVLFDAAQYLSLCVFRQLCKGLCFWICVIVTFQNSLRNFTQIVVYSFIEFLCNYTEACLLLFKCYVNNFILVLVCIYLDIYTVLIESK